MVRGWYLTFLPAVFDGSKRRHVDPLRFAAITALSTQPSPLLMPTRTMFAASLSLSLSRSLSVCANSQANVGLFSTRTLQDGRITAQDLQTVLADEKGARLTPSFMQVERQLGQVCQLSPCLEAAKHGKSTCPCFLKRWSVTQLV